MEGGYIEKRAQYPKGDGKMSKRLPKTLTDEELTALLRVPNVQTPTGLRGKAILQVMAAAGLRVGEVVTLKTSQVETQNWQTILRVTQGKGDVDRAVPLPDHAADTLLSWLDKRRELGIGNGHVFCTIRAGINVRAAGRDPDTGRLVKGETVTARLEPGRPLGTGYVRAMVARLAKKAGIDKRVSPHTLRHTAAKRLLEACGNIRQVQEFLGHRNVSTTQVYTEVTASEVRQAVDEVSDPEKQPSEPEPTQAEQVAAAVLRGLPAEVQTALTALVSRACESRR